MLKCTFKPSWYETSHSSLITSSQICAKRR